MGGEATRGRGEGRPVRGVAGCPKVTTAVLHGGESRKADNAPEVRVEGRGGRREEPHGCLGGRRAEGKGKLGADRRGDGAVPEGVLAASGGGGREAATGACPGTDTGAGDSIQRKDPEGLLEGIVARQAPGSREGGVEGGKGGRERGRGREVEG